MGRPETDGSAVRRFPPPGIRPGRVRSAIGAVIALVAFVGSMTVVSLGPEAGETLSYPVVVLLMLIRG